MTVIRILIASLIFLAACKTVPDNRIVLTIRAPQLKNQKVQVHVARLIDSEIDVLDKTQLDSLGNGVLQAGLKAPVFAVLVTGSRYTEIYLKPGDNLTVSISDSHAVPVRFTGKGEEINNYMAHGAAIQNRIERKNGFVFPNLGDPAAYRANLKEIIDSLQLFHKRYTDTITLSAEDEHLMRSRNAVNIFQSRTNYQWNYLVIHPGADLASSLALEIPQLPEGKNIPYDSSLINRMLPSYAVSFQSYLFNQYIIPMETDSLFRNDPHAYVNFPLLLRAKIKRDQHPGDVEEILLAKNIDYQLSSFGITPVLDSALALFDSEYPASRWRSSLQDRYARWDALRPGKPAPGFSGVTAQGDTVFLADLKGKLVLIDVWATWCKPCVAEIPHSIALRKKLAAYDKLVFLNYSVDENLEAWKKKIDSEPEWKDLQWLEVDRSLSVNYQRWGVPRYILIGADGKIINADSPPPSDPGLQQMLTGLAARL